MKILDDFSNLTRFVHDEFMKMQQSYGFQQMDQKDLKKISKTVLSSFYYANSTTKRKLKYYTKVDWAIFTAPHCWLWRFFHKRLWQNCLEEIKRREEEKDNAVESDNDDLQAMPPQQAVDLSALSLESTVITPAERLLNSASDLTTD